jgi:hypothetical protein
MHNAVRPELLDGDRNVPADACNDLGCEWASSEAVVHRVTLDELPCHRANRLAAQSDSAMFDQVREGGVSQAGHRSDFTFYSLVLAWIEVQFQRDNVVRGRAILGCDSQCAVDDALAADSNLLLDDEAPPNCAITSGGRYAIGAVILMRSLGEGGAVRTWRGDMSNGTAAGNPVGLAGRQSGNAVNLRAADRRHTPSEKWPLVGAAMLLV